MSDFKPPRRDTEVDFLCTLENKGEIEMLLLFLAMSLTDPQQAQHDRTELAM